MVGDGEWRDASWRQIALVEKRASVKTSEQGSWRNRAERVSKKLQKGARNILQDEVVMVEPEFVWGGGLRVVGDGGDERKGIHLCRDTVDLVKLALSRYPN